MKLMMASELSLAQRMTLDACVREKRRAERTGAEPRDATPRPAQSRGIEHGMREHHRRAAAVQEHFAHEHARTAPAGKHEALVTVRPSQSLKHDFHAHFGTTRCDTRSERAAIGQPRPISACGSGG